MLRNCNSLDLRMLPPVGIELRPWEETNLDDAAQLTVHAYENIVDREISIHYESFDGCRNYLRNIISKLGCGSFVKNASFCALHLHSKQWIGFVLTSSVSSFNGPNTPSSCFSGISGKGYRHPSANSLHCCSFHPTVSHDLSK